MSERRFVIAIGSPDCPGYGLARLDRVAGDVEEVTRFFTQATQGYERALAAELPLGATARQIQEALDGWFGSEDRREDDCVVIYVAGHGDSGERFNDHVLFTHDSCPPRASSVIRTADLVRWLFGGAGARPQSVLLILDVCYAGQGAGEALAELGKGEAKVLRSDAGFWVVATSDPNSEAGDGAFVSAFLAVMKDEAWAPRGGAQFVSPYDLTVAVNQWFQLKPSAQQALVYAVAGGRVEAPFIRIPGFTLDLDGLSVADQAHWDPKARGVDAASMPGWFFSGRHAVLRTLSEWLRAERSDLRARVVTGGPGSGKSAVLGWLTLAARAATRPAMEAAGLLEDAALAPPLGSVAARVHASGMRLHQMTSTLAALLSCGAREPAALIAELSARDGAIGIVVDSLDEAAEPGKIERELLSGLAACPAVRLIVGGRRRKDRPPLAGAALPLDLDDARYFERADLVSYVVSRLTAPAASYAPKAQHLHARRIAEVVASRAGFSFLYARLVSRALAQKALVDTSRAGWQHDLDLPAEVSEAFGQDLDRFDAETRRRFVDLLVPLAYARGKGLPQKNVWATVAAHLAGRAYTNADLRELKERAGYYLVQDTEGGEVVFRLFHETFAEYLRALTSAEDVERRYCEALLSLLPAPPAGSEPWDQIGEPYLLNHLPSHLGAGRLLEAQLDDPGFLLRVAPDALLPELPRLSSPKAQRIGRAYHRAAHWIRAGDRSAAMSYLLWGAHQHGAGELAERLQALRPRLGWYPEWAVWRMAASGYVLGRADETVSALACGEDEQAGPVAVCGYRGGAVRAWSLTTSEMLWEHRPSGLREKRGLTASPPEVTHIVYGGRDGERLIIVAWNEGSLGVFDLQDGGKRAWWSGGIAFRALCIVADTPDCLLVAATDDLSLLSWRLPGLELLARRARAAGASFYGLAPIDFGGQPAVVSGTDSMRAGRESERWPIRLWRARDLHRLWRAGADEVANAADVRVCRLGKASWVVVVTVHGDLVLLNPDPESGGTLYATRRWESRPSHVIGALRRGSETFLLAQSDDAALLAWQVHLGEEGGTDRLADEPLRIGEASAKHWSDIVELNARPVVVSADARQLRVWDVEELLAQNTRRGGAGEGEAFGADEGPLGTLAASDSRIATDSRGYGVSDLRLWSDDGRPLWRVRLPGERVTALGMAEVAEGPIVTGVTGEGRLHVWSARDGRELRAPVKVGDQILALSVRSRKGRPVAFLAAGMQLERKDLYVVRAWDLETGEEIDTTYRSDLDEKWWGLEPFGYYKHKRLYCVDSLDWEGRTLVAFAGPHGEVRAMELESLREIDRWEGGISGKDVHSITMVASGGRPLVFGGDEQGRIFARDLARREDLCPRIEAAHRGSVAALAARQTSAGLVVASGGADRYLHLWRDRLIHLTGIECEGAVRGLAFMGADRLAVATDRGLTLLRLDWELLFVGNAERTGLVAEPR